MTEAIIAELRAITARLDSIEARLDAKRPYVSGSKAAAMIGVSYQTFKRKWVDTGLILPRGNKYETARVRMLCQ